MKKPLDELVHNRVGKVKAARVYSNIVSPPVMFSVLGLAIALKERPFWEGVAWAAVYGFLVSLLPILFVLFLLKTGRIAELHMSNTGERHLPYVVAVLCGVATFGLFTWLDGPAILRCLTIFNVVELILLGVINVFWLISIHTTGIMATMMIVGLVFGWVHSLWVLPFVISVSWVRLYLQRHTPGQVIAGLIIGVISVGSLTLVGCF
ncbi:MAG: phosphatase PAP2 family protein [Chloroflexota bacterium]|nr:hypothetical protein [Anaerolineales bacterium]MCB8967957.1 hypothetical protein [Ardenticatenaceae bacterium]